MRKPLQVAALLTGAVLGGVLGGVLGPALGPAPALADWDDCTVPMSDWQPVEAVMELARAQGWTVRRIVSHDGCYVIRGWDGSGQVIQAIVDPGSLAIREVGHGGHGGSHHGRRDGQDADDDD